MDILISSNLERLLYELTNHNAPLICTWMNQLKKTGQYQIEADLHRQIQEIFWSDFATDEETLKTINETYTQYGYVLDTHTAVGKNVYDKYVAATGDSTKTIIVSTASPFKFSNKVAEAILGTEILQSRNEFALLELLSETCKLPIPEALKNLEHKPIHHSIKTERDQMKTTVQKLLNL
jgi:threonine synthase